MYHRYSYMDSSYSHPLAHPRKNLSRDTILRGSPNICFYKEVSRSSLKHASGTLKPSPTDEELTTKIEMLENSWTSMSWIILCVMSTGLTSLLSRREPCSSCDKNPLEKLNFFFYSLVPYCIFFLNQRHKLLRAFH